MNAILSYNFLSQVYEHDFVLFRKVENDLKHASPDAIHATQLSHIFDSHLEAR